MTGLYAVVAHSVAQRTHEIGIRMALGAGTASIHWLVMRRALVHLSIGLLLGLAGALAVGRLMHGMFATGNDPTTRITVTALLTIVAITACLWPARRATRFHPAVALRHE